METRKEANQIFYRLRDPLLGDVLEALRQYFLAHMNEALTMIKDEQQMEKASTAKQKAGRR